jgi:hypothetical protein
MCFESSLAFEASWINLPKWKEGVPANTHKKSSEKQSCSTCRQEESIEKLMTKFQAKVESFWNLMWYMLTSIEKKALTRSWLAPFSRSILAATMRDSTNSAAVRRQHGTEQNRTEEREVGREGGADSGGFHRVTRSSMG